MKQERESIQAKISDWLVFIVGWGLVGWQVYKFIDHDFEGDNFLLQVFIFLIAMLFIFKPQTLVDLVTEVAKRKSKDI